jgi:hypothetical protein
VSLTAPQVSGYSFAYWDVDGAQQTAGASSITVTMNAPHTATAHYTKTYNLTIITTSGGSTSPPPGTSTYSSGTTVQVTANANTGYVFDHWQLDGTNVGSANPYTVVMNADHTLTAIFVRPPAPVGGYSYSLQKVKSPQPLTLYLPFVAAAAVVITAIGRRRKRTKK